ncbi:hypothetical protein BGW38_006598 [Lunasporangiospora selenospora]|uniref:RING-type domain-containing protein n=1 Tax=Lunasporangiospora selenospora TaxID=979761 RepID=A0A9P6FZQ4_9FUNG|nr:hypothetical protein BGW38_006598 [Lunasporangiospora selenospora]
MASYYQDHSLEDPHHTRKSTPATNQGGYGLGGGSNRLNPDLSYFMPREDTDEAEGDGRRNHPSSNWTSPLSGIPSAGDFHRLAEMFGSFREREEPLGDEQHQQFLDNLITQLMDEANASYLRGLDTEPTFHSIFKTISGKHGPPPASKSFIRELPYVPTKELKSDEACIVCNENFSENDSKAGVTKLPCKHYFDRDCIVPWLELHNNCPACRAEVPSDDPVWIKKKRDEELAKYAAEAEIDEDWMYS